ncbi:M23 family metallopeptidase [Tumidithrix elongata RA019]|uniref:M23 family metallopeptidase n=1 Tax=Tumidithrix elongata BACA0141 TaxID=2716417 RepID=A0AAW9Q4Q5_9CYAN|nr:M23 family metallopeptidase [Tumidithrix elongata RA019]
MKQLRKMPQKSLLKLSLLSLCLSMSGNVMLVTGLSDAQAAKKSAISPEVTAPNPAPRVAPEPVAAPQPQIDRSTPAIEIQTSSSSTRSNTQGNTQGNTRGATSEPAMVEIQSRQPQSSATKPASGSSNSGNVEIVFESRKSGCQARGQDLGSRQANLCAPEVEIARNAPTNLIYSSTGEPVVQVRKLTRAEIESMSVPSNGDKRMLFPLSIPAIISSSFGYRVHPITQAVKFHQGTDIAAAEGTPVVAAYSGKVEISGWLGGYGLAVVISHGDTHETRYAHLSEVFVKPGQVVKQGTVIGLVGTTGFSTGPHLHFELWERIRGEWTVMDPTPHLILALERLNTYLAQLNNPESVKPSIKPSINAKPSINKLGTKKPVIDILGMTRLFGKTAKG